MKRYLLLLSLPLLLATCGKDISPVNPLIGRWSLYARLDSAGKWQPLLFPLNSKPPAIVFKRDGTMDHFGSDGQLQRDCCQPVRYTYSPIICGVGDVCSSAGTIIYTDWVKCTNAKCVFPQAQSVGGLSEVYLDLYANPASLNEPVLRYQRVN